MWQRESYQGKSTQTTRYQTVRYHRSVCGTKECQTVNCIHLWPQVLVDTLQQQFGSLIRRRRLAAGIGQEGLADTANLHRTHISLLERGKRMPSLLVIKKLARALGTTMASLMEELEQEELPADEEKIRPKPIVPIKSKKKPT
ncbi:MAG: hypothetical protein C0467_15990 [Planctomycetaceae bacterium]|nr:hypothetical protein [Planctomycetaceae bacterium]